MATSLQEGLQLNLAHLGEVRQGELAELDVAVVVDVDQSERLSKLRGLEVTQVEIIDDDALAGDGSVLTAMVDALPKLAQEPRSVVKHLATMSQHSVALYPSR